MPDADAILPDRQSFERISKAVRRVEGVPFVDRTAPWALNLPRNSLILARIVSSSQDGGNWRWTYTFEEVEQSAAGFDTISAKSGGLTGTAYNTLEYPNGATGVLGNGMNVDDLTGTGYTPQPIKNGTPVFLTRRAATNGDTVYWFTASNGVAGGC